MPKVQASKKWREVDVHAATTVSGGYTNKSQLVETLVHEEVKYVKVSAYANWLQMICTGAAKRICDVPVFRKLQEAEETHFGRKLQEAEETHLSKDPMADAMLGVDPMADAMLGVAKTKAMRGQKRKAPHPPARAREPQALQAEVDDHKVSILYVPSTRKQEKTFWVADRDIPWLLGKVHEELQGTEPVVEEHIGQATYSSEGLWSLRWRDGRTGELQEVRAEVPKHKVVDKSKMALSPESFLRKKAAARTKLMDLARMRGYDGVESSPKSSGFVIGS